MPAAPQGSLVPAAPSTRFQYPICADLGRELLEDSTGVVKGTSGLLVFGTGDCDGHDQHKVQLMNDNLSRRTVTVRCNLCSYERVRRWSASEARGLKRECIIWKWPFGTFVGSDQMLLDVGGFKGWGSVEANSGIRLSGEHLKDSRIVSSWIGSVDLIGEAATTW